MNDQAWGVVMGAAAVIALRALDWFLPKGWVSLWAANHGRKADNKQQEDSDE